MNITLDTDLPSLYELELLFDNEDYPTLKKIYSGLERNKKDGDYYVLKSPSNIEKIVSFFNSEVEMEKIKKELTKMYYLENMVKINDIFILDFPGNKSLSSIKAYVNLELSNQDLIAFVEESCAEFIKKIHDSDKNKVISKYSVKFKEQLDILEISCDANRETFRLKLKATYMLKGEDFKYFDFFINERVLLNASRTLSKEMRIELTEMFVKKINKNEVKNND